MIIYSNCIQQPNTNICCLMSINVLIQSWLFGVFIRPNAVTREEGHFRHSKTVENFESKRVCTKNIQNLQSYDLDLPSLLNTLEIANQALFLTFRSLNVVLLTFHKQGYLCT